MILNSFVRLRPGAPALLVSALLLSACGTTHPGADLENSQTRSFFQPPPPQDEALDYKIGPFDRLDLAVFGVPDLSDKGLVVDAGGSVLLPLIGKIKASGLTSAELAQAVERRLLQTYMRSPQVTVSVAESATQKVTVDGSVTTPGVYELRGQTTLLQAVAMAAGPSRVAALSEVAILRTVNGQRVAARFDLAQIRGGGMPDPEILGNDTIVVGLSHGKAAWRDALAALPVLGVFSPFVR
jgi:polysaccharide export outer membrane protein